MDDNSVVRTILTLGTSTATLITNARSKHGWLIIGKRKKGLAGKWNGKFHQPVGPYGRPINGSIHLDLRLGIRNVNGKGRFSAAVKKGRKEYTDIEVTGGFRYDRFLHLNYANMQASKIHFGTLLLEYRCNSDELVGGFVGWGVLEEKCVSGTLSLIKQP